MSRTVSASVPKDRDPKYKAVDASAVHALAQAAVNVELFTIPLYMGTLYSIQGTHPINEKNLSFFKGRLWPGAATTANPTTANEKAFNIIFSIFIQEMLHLQLAANIATAIGLQPNFNSEMLQNTKTFGWTCYGPDKTVIPHIVDLRDMSAPYTNLKVNIAALSKDQINLFLAIEEPADDARKHIVKGKYFPEAPFADWQTWDTEKNLPMFGTIGQLYQCYYDYLHIRYSDGTSLWQYVTIATAQRDLFNVEVAGSHPLREYPGFEASLISLRTVVSMMDAITDQGEGSTLKKDDAMLAVVEEKYRSSEQALQQDYPSYTDTGQPAPSRDAAARFVNDGKDHFERFQEVMALLAQGKIVTWPDWFKAGNKWKKEDLQAKDYNPSNNPKLPSTEVVAAALNALAAPAQRAANYKMLSQVAAGSIAGVTTVLNKYWERQDLQKPVAFPSPSMAGTGDRISICWALFGQGPDLSLGIDPPSDQLYHACQALDLSKVGNQCAPPEVFHTCIGSNACKAQGGCGFVQKTSGGGICGHATGTRGPLSAGNLCGAPSDVLYSPPTDNKCGTLGGCAVPISASQVYPKSGTMQLFDFTGSGNTPVPIEKMDFKVGELVHDVAYRAYVKVMQHRKKQVPVNPPPPSQLRLAFPPST